MALKLHKQRIFDAVFSMDTELEKTRLIAEFEQEEPNPFLTIRLRKTQINTLAGYLCLLPFQDFQAIALFYCSGYSYQRIAKTLGIKKARGVVFYIKDRLTQCMGLPRPIAERFWYDACQKAMDDYPFPK